ncbi:MAG TPA: HAMP domain-containing sensor histidine kinase [Deinococcales bacterium]|nr:HAMP domain-containing sensor histidine kinase [Deinococcales bacterium]
MMQAPPAAATVTTRKGSRPVSLRVTVAAAIAGLAFIPNVILAATLILPIVRETPEALPQVLWPAVAWLIGIAGLSTAVGWVIAGGLLDPLERLRHQVTGLDRTTDRRLALPETESEPVEVASLRAAFSGLLGNLDAETAKRSAFMATLVHDLKTPIIANSHVLEAIRDDRRLDQAERDDLVDALIRENDRLLGLVQQMVDAHRFERERVRLNLTPTDLRAAAEAAASARRAPAAARGLNLTLEGEGRALASRPELERAIGNLLDNALRYARQSITVTVDGPTLTVSDDGPGLPAPLDELARPFQSQTVTLGGQELAAGTGGLGLFIAREIAAAHGGTLEAQPGPGARLRLQLQPEVPS